MGGRLLQAIDEYHASNAPPFKYSVPYKAVNEFRAAMQARKVGQNDKV